MKRSLSHGAGYLVVDHTNSPGTAEVPSGQLLERDVMACSHCQRAVVLNPGRVRARAVCPKCQHYVCDSCEAIRVKTGACVPFKAVLDRATEIAEKYSGEPDHPNAVIDVDELSKPAEPKIVVTDDWRE